MQSSTIN